MQKKDDGQKPLKDKPKDSLDRLLQNLLEDEAALRNREKDHRTTDKNRDK